MESGKFKKSTKSFKTPVGSRKGNPLDCPYAAVSPRALGISNIVVPG